MFRLEIRTTLRFQTVVVNLTQDRSILFYKGMTVSQTGIIDKGGISLNNQPPRVRIQATVQNDGSNVRIFRQVEI